jgi:7-cyano-7-deazaguanine synthase
MLPAVKAVVLLSGGLDSATTLATAIAEGLEAHALTVRYGQRHLRELEAAADVAHALGAASHVVVDVDLGAIGGSALTADIDVPMDRSPDEIGRGIPVTYVPARNTILLALALAHAEVRGAHEIWLGVNAIDYSGYPDCRPEFLEAFEALAAKATKAGTLGERLRLRAPLLRLSKREIVERAIALGVPLAKTWTCYAPDSGGRACGRCDACRLRLEGFRAAGVPDPVAYA